MGKQIVGIHSLPLTFYDPPVVLHSGSESHWFVNCESIFADKKVRELVLDCWERELRRIFPGHKLFHFIGVPRGGIPWAKAIATKMGGTFALLGEPGISIAGSAIIAVDDVLTTGASIGEVKDTRWALVVVARVPPGIVVSATSAWAKIDLPLLEG